MSDNKVRETHIKSRGDRAGRRGSKQGTSITGIRIPNQAEGDSRLSKELRLGFRFAGFTMRERRKEANAFSNNQDRLQVSNGIKNKTRNLLLGQCSRKEELHSYNSCT